MITNIFLKIIERIILLNKIEYYEILNLNIKQRKKITNSRFLKCLKVNLFILVAFSQFISFFIKNE